ncbi:hypothetical protein KFL_001360100 [Klebsormidium nitens]|uniref:Uncharacterized protein n=1 Tax=Klebsormidium nitens TaxID=105231 RepID=A0A1Y1HY69_KLENI|nr:hypothetical protein KFL_001360100 [Klebsormidium nitens]|eukprot:GAQ83113.1 hypothetical protein KFL_001360100 [Klebsormidium nitens]
MEGSSDVVDTTFAVGKFDSRKVWKIVYPYLLNSDINFEGQYGRLRLVRVGLPKINACLLTEQNCVTPASLRAWLGSRPVTVCDLGTISALPPEREAQAVTFGCEHGLSAAVFEEVDLSSSVTVDAAACSLVANGYTRQPAEVFRSGKTGKVVWRTPSAKPLLVGSSAVLVAYTGKLDVEYLASVYNCSLENAAIILSVLSTKYSANARSVSPISIKAYDEDMLRLEGSIVRGMSGGFVADPADPSKVHAYQIKSRKLAALNNDQEVTASSLMKRSFEGDMA